MINILIPMAGKKTFETSPNSPFPKILQDIEGKLLVERAAAPFIALGGEKSIVVAVPEDEIADYQLDKVLTLLDNSVKVCEINSETQGSACSALLSLEQIELDKPLLISSFEQVLDLNLQSYVDDFLSSGVDAGVLTFESIHPKWSYVKCNEYGFVVQAAEKMPISKNAVAGLYYFRTAQLFVDAAMDMIRKDVKFNNMFYISHTLNEVILNEGKVKAIPINKSNYFHLQDAHSLDMYESTVADRKHSREEKVRQRTEQYVAAFNSKNIIAVEAMFSPHFLLHDPSFHSDNHGDVVQFLSTLFTSTAKLEFIAESIVVEDMKSVIVFTLRLDDKVFEGSDYIQWDDDYNMSSLFAYLNEKC